MRTQLTPYPATCVTMPALAYVFPYSCQQIAGDCSEKRQQLKCANITGPHGVFSALALGVFHHVRAGVKGRI